MICRKYDQNYDYYNKILKFSIPYQKQWQIKMMSQFCRHVKRASLSLGQTTVLKVSKSTEKVNSHLMTKNAINSRISLMIRSMRRLIRIWSNQLTMWRPQRLWWWPVSLRVRSFRFSTLSSLYTSGSMDMETLIQSTHSISMGSKNQRRQKPLLSLSPKTKISKSITGTQLIWPFCSDLGSYGASGATSLPSWFTPSSSLCSSSATIPSMSSRSFSLFCSASAVATW